MESALLVEPNNDEANQKMKRVSNHIEEKLKEAEEFITAKKFESAKIESQSVLEIEPEHTEAKQQMERIRIGQNNRDSKYVSDLNQRIDRNPRDYDSRCQRARFYIDHDNKVAAEPDIKELQKHAPECERSLWTKTF